MPELAEDAEGAGVEQREVGGVPREAGEGKGKVVEVHEYGRGVIASSL